MKQISELNTKSRIPNPIPRGGLAIVPTAVSGGGDIMCAMTMALRLKQQGLGPLSVLVLEGMYKGRNAAIINKIKDDPHFAGITVHSIHELPVGFKIPDVVISGPGANDQSHRIIKLEFKKIAPVTEADSFKYIQLEEPGFIEGHYRFKIDPSVRAGMGVTDFELGLPVSAGEYTPIRSAFDQRPERLLALQNPWLKSQLLGESPDTAIGGYDATTMLALIYHHIDVAFERSLYLLALAAKDDHRDMDIVAKVWDVDQPIITQVAWTLIQTHYPRQPGIPFYLNTELLAEAGVGKVVMVRPATADLPERTKELRVATEGKTIRIIDPFPLAASDMETIRDAAIPIQGCSGLMSVSRSIELNKIPLLEVLPLNRSFYRELLELAKTIDPNSTGLAKYLTLSEDIIQCVPMEEVTEWNNAQQKYIYTDAKQDSINLSETVQKPEIKEPKQSNMDRNGIVIRSRRQAGRPQLRYQVIRGLRNEVMTSTEQLSRRHGAGECPIADPRAALEEMARLLTDPKFHQQVDTFNQFVVKNASLFDRLPDKIGALYPEPIGQNSCKIC